MPVTSSSRYSLPLSSSSSIIITTTHTMASIAINDGTFGNLNLGGGGGRRGGGGKHGLGGGCRGIGGPLSKR
ncbi:hypothetical protein NW757_005774 [Fusarium falciforme]|nr:hypothetical protein NW757_005774 [Fusarium falciforme]